jgi:hypothetical protein
VPVFSYFLVVGSVLTGLLCYANSVMVPAPLPFSVSQKMGLPEPLKAPMDLIKVPNREIAVVSVKPSVEVKKPVKTVRRHRPAQIVRQSVPQGHYAVYPPRELGSIW